MKRAILIAALSAVILIFVGCATLNIQTTLTKPVLMTDDETVQTVRHFSKTVRVWWVLGGLAALSEPDFNSLLAAEIGNNSGIKNLKFKTQYTFVDILINGLTYGIIVPRTIIIEGDVAQ